MPEIPEIGIGAVQVPEIPAWRAMPPQSIPVAPPVTLQIGFPVADIPGCVETRNSGAGAQSAGAPCLRTPPFGRPRQNDRPPALDVPRPEVLLRDRGGALPRQGALQLRLLRRAGPHTGSGRGAGGERARGARGARGDGSCASPPRHQRRVGAADEDDAADAAREDVHHGGIASRRDKASAQRDLRRRHGRRVQSGALALRRRKGRLWRGLCSCSRARARAAAVAVASSSRWGAAWARDGS